MYAKRRREGRAEPRLVDATGTRRRLQALAALGWSPAYIARELGYATDQYVRRILSPAAARVNVRTRDAVAGLYEQLSMRPGPSDRARAHARSAGWVPPLQWDEEDLDDPAATPSVSAKEDDGLDPVAVQRACAGEPVKLTRAERERVVAELTAAGRSAQAIAEQLGLSARQVVRIRGGLRESASTGAAAGGSAPDLGEVTAKVQRAREAVARRAAAVGSTEPPDVPQPSRHTERSSPCLTR